MQITYNNTTINFFDFEHPEQILMTLSGGLDSASLMYLICKHLPQVEVIPFTARDVKATKDAESANDIVSWMQQKFSSVKIHDLSVYDFDQEDRSLVTESEIDQAIKDNSKWRGLEKDSISKTLQLNSICKKIKNLYPDAVRCDAMTANPPAEIMQTMGFYNIAERRRDSSQLKNQLPNKRLYKPYVNVDKKFVADVYVQNNLMHDLFPLTRSCVGRAEHTDNYTRECHSCFWCYEKKWAFDLEW